MYFQWLIGVHVELEQARWRYHRFHPALFVLAIEAQDFNGQRSRTWRCRRKVLMVDVSARHPQLAHLHATSSSVPMASGGFFKE